MDNFDYKNYLKNNPLLKEEYENIDEGMKDWLIGGLITLATLGGVGKVYQMDQNAKADRASRIEYYDNILSPQLQKFSQDDLTSLGYKINSKTKDYAFTSQTIPKTPEEVAKYDKVFAKYAEKYMKSNPQEFSVDMEGMIQWTPETVNLK